MESRQLDFLSIARPLSQAHLLGSHAAGAKRFLGGDELAAVTAGSATFRMPSKVRIALLPGLGIALAVVACVRTSDRLLGGER